MMLKCLDYAQARTNRSCEFARRAGWPDASADLRVLCCPRWKTFERWFGRRPEVTLALRALIEADLLAAGRSLLHKSRTSRCDNGMHKAFEAI